MCRKVEKHTLPRCKFLHGAKKMIDIALSLTAGKLLSKAAKIYLLVVVKVPRELYSMDV